MSLFITRLLIVARMLRKGRRLLVFYTYSMYIHKNEDSLLSIFIYINRNVCSSPRGVWIHSITVCV